MMTISEIMTDHPFTLAPENSVKQAMDLMQQERIRHLPIVDEHHHLLGLVTLTDILAARESRLLLISPEREAEFTDSVQLAGAQRTQGHRHCHGIRLYRRRDQSAGINGRTRPTRRVLR